RSGAREPYLFYDKFSVYPEANWIMGNERPLYGVAPALVSDDITWETINTFNVGVESNFLDSRLGVTFDWYDRKTLDMLGAAYEWPYVIVPKLPIKNMPDLWKKGFDLVLDWNNNTSEDLTTTLN